MNSDAVLPTSSSQLQATLGKMALALNCVEESIAWTDAHGCIQWCNAAFERLVNHTAAAMSGQLLTHVLPLMQKGDVLPLSQHPVSWGLAMKQQREGQYEFQRHDRSVRLALTVAPLPCSEDDRASEGVMLLIRRLPPLGEQPRSLPPTRLELAETTHAHPAELNHDRNRLEFERQQIEASLRESEQRFRNMFDMTAVATAITSLEGAYLQVNAAYCQTVGYTEAELLTLSFQQINHPNDIALGALLRRKLIAGEISSCNIEKRCIHKDGHIIWCLLSLLIVRDLQQQPLYYVAQMQDITDRKQAEAALGESEARLKLALESAQMSTWDWNISTNEAIYSGHLNPGFNLPSDVQSAASESFLQAINPVDRDYVVEALARALKGEAYNVEFRVTWADGTQHWVSSKGKTYFDQQSTPVRMLGVLRDTTDRKQLELALKRLNQELEQRVQQRTAQLEQINERLQMTIAAHEQTEATLRKSEERFRIVFDCAPLAISLADAQTYQIIKVNQAHHKLFGYSNAELASLTHVDVTHPDDVGKTLDQTRQLLDGTISRFQIEKRFVKKNGDWIWANLTVTLIHDPDGRIYSIGMIEDITDRKQAEEALRGSQQLLQLVIDSVPTTIFWKDKNLRYLGCNHQFAINAGLATPKDIIGKNDFELPWAVHADRCQRKDLQVISSKQPMLNVEEALAKAGGERWIKASKIPLQDKNGTVVGILGTYEDITERRQMDQALRLTQFSIDRASDPIWWVEPDGTIYYVNDAACRDLGDIRDMIIGKQVSDFNPDLPVEAWADHWDMIKSKGSFTFEARVQAKDGTLFLTEVTANYIELNGKEYHCSFVRNITDRKQAEDQLKASLTEKEVLLKEVHHRVKNNLQTVCSLLNLQANTIQDPNVLAPFRDSQRRIKAMALVHERLYQSESLAKVNFSDYVHHLVTDLIHSYSADPTKIHLNIEVGQVELPVGAAIPCGLIINELVTNALKYAFPDDRTGEIQICFSVSTTNQCRLLIADDGVGFLSSMATVDHTPPLDSLGLQLVHAFVHQLRGTIELDCSRGSRFELLFPNPGKNDER